MSGSDFLDRVVAASGLMDLIAPFTIRRLLISAGVAPDEVTPAELATAMPHLERGLGVYLDDDQLRVALADLRRLAQEESAPQA
jgi:hypothetical protein